MTTLSVRYVLGRDGIGKSMQRLKRIWWDLVGEARVLAMWWLSLLPGRLGAQLRGKLMRRFLKRLGHHTIIQSGARITNPNKVSIGSHCNLAQGFFIAGGGGVTIGNWVGFGPDVKVWSVNHRFADPETPWMLQGWDYKPVIIEDDVWLAASVFVMPGVTIGKGAIVSACSVVSKSIPPYAIVAGNPARVIGWRKAPGAEQESTSARPEPHAIPR